jgi:hypothetical protein
MGYKYCQGRISGIGKVHSNIIGEVENGGKRERKTKHACEQGMMCEMQRNDIGILQWLWFVPKMRKKLCHS